MLRITMSQICSRFRNLATASPQPAARITASLRCASSRPNCSAWSPSSSMSKTLSIDTPGASDHEYLGRTGNRYFAARLKIVDGQLTIALRKVQRLIPVRKTDNYVEYVHQFVIIEPRAHRMARFQQVVYV